MGAGLTGTAPNCGCEYAPFCCITAFDIVRYISDLRREGASEKPILWLLEIICIEVGFILIKVSASIHVKDFISMDMERSLLHRVKCGFRLCNSSAKIFVGPLSSFSWLSAASVQKSSSNAASCPDLITSATSSTASPIVLGTGGPIGFFCGSALSWLG